MSVYIVFSGVYSYTDYIGIGSAVIAFVIKYPTPNIFKGHAYEGMGQVLHDVSSWANAYYCFCVITLRDVNFKLTLT